MANKFDNCGLLPSPSAEAKTLIKNFKDYYKPDDRRRDINPWGIYLSKSYLQEILNGMTDEQNCIYIRLGIVEPPSDGEVPISWMLRTVEAIDDPTGRHYRNKGRWHVSDFPSGDDQPQEPVVMKDPNH